MPRIYSPRLKNFDYMGPLAAHLVFVTGERDQLFEFAEVCLEALSEAAQKHSAVIHAYCLMPDHVHVLIELHAGAHLTAFARLFKQLSGFRLKRLVGSEAWQVSYYDHVLRSDEDILDVARYIWENPVEDSLVSDYLDYRFSGPRELMTTLADSQQT